MKLVALAVVSLLVWVYRKPIETFANFVGMILTWMLIVAGIAAAGFIAWRIVRKYWLKPEPKVRRPEIVDELPPAVNMRLSPRPRYTLHPERIPEPPSNVLRLDDYRPVDDVPAS
jgi:hypothetical protein